MIDRLMVGWQRLRDARRGRGAGRHEAGRRHAVRERQRGVRTLADLLGYLLTSLLTWVLAYLVLAWVLAYFATYLGLAYLAAQRGAREDRPQGRRAWLLIAGCWWLIADC